MTPSSSSSAPALCAFAAGASLGAAATLVYSQRALGARKPTVPADSAAAPLLARLAPHLPSAVLEYLPVSLELCSTTASRGGRGLLQQPLIEEGAAPATPTHGEAAAPAEDEGGVATGGGAAEGGGGATGAGAAAGAATPPARAPSDLLLPLALTQRVGDGGGEGSSNNVRSVPLQLTDVSDSASAMATPRGGGNGGGSGNDRGPPPPLPTPTTLRRAAAAAAAAAQQQLPPRPPSQPSSSQQQQQQRPASGAARSSASSPPPPSEYKLALVVRGDLRWARQKTAVMCSHASVGAWKRAWKAASSSSGGGGGGGSGGGQGGDPSALAKWEREKSPKVVLRAEDEAELGALLEAAKRAGLPIHAMSEVTAAGGGGGAAAAAGAAGAAAAAPAAAALANGGSSGAPQKSRVILAIGPAPSEAINAVVGDLRLL
jgi:peptidyl-tRNA hydrolase